MSVNRWFVSQTSASHARLRLFCLPFAGGGAYTYRDWHEVLGPEVEVCAVRLPGRESRMAETACHELEPLVAGLGDAVSARLDLPFAIFGHSMGAVIGFNLIRRLREQHGCEPVHFIASARFAPQLPDPDPPMHDLPHDEFIEEMRRLEGTPAEVFESPELLELLLPMLRADFTICETYRYRPEPPLGCPISAYGGLSDSTIDRGQLEAWAEQTTGPFVVRQFPGNHFFIQSARAQVLESLRRDLQPYVDGPA